MQGGLLTFVDTVAVQDYIFRTNDLKQIVGASYIVEAVTHDWLADALPKNNNILNINDCHHMFNGKTIENDNLEAEVYLAGGGNATIAFASEASAYEFAYQLSKKVILNAPGLSIAIAHIPFDIRSHPLGGDNGALANLAREVDRVKMNLLRTQPQLGVGVTLQCDFTHLPAVETFDGQPVSAEVNAKLVASIEANRRLQGLLERIDDGIWQQAGLNPNRDFPRQLDELGVSEGERSILAVIHIDGNGMSKRFRAISDRYTTIEQNRELLDYQQALSFSIQDQAEKALVHTMQYLAGKILPDENGNYFLFDQIPLLTDKLPFRPILYGGDDVTFIADGRIGLWLAEEYLRTVSVEPLQDGKNLYSRAGVAIVKAHYPFSRAYHLAEQLAGTCKQWIGELRNELERIGKWDPEKDGINALDWQIAVSGHVRRLDEIRKTEYHISQGDLVMRPVYIGQIGSTSSSYAWRSWDQLIDIMAGFNTWQDSHNKIKALRSVLVKDENAVRNFIALNELELPAVPGLPRATQKSGWYNNRCVYFDAVELIDLLASE